MFKLFLQQMDVNTNSNRGALAEAKFGDITKQADETGYDYD